MEAYIPTRKSADLDVTEERSAFAGETLSFQRPEKVKNGVRIFGGGSLGKIGSGTFALPNAKKRLLVEVPGDFT